MQNPKRRHSRVLNCAKYNKGDNTMDTHRRIINEIKTQHHLSGRTNIGSLANSHGLSEEDIRILTFTNGTVIEESAPKDEIAFDKNIFKPLSPHDTIG